MTKHGLNHGQTISTHLDLALAHGQLGNEKRASTHLELVWTHGRQACEDGYHQSCADAAVARCLLGKCDREAMVCAQKGIEQAPDSADAQEAKAFILMKQGQVRRGPASERDKEKEAKQLYCKIRSMGPLLHPAAIKRLDRYCPGK